MSFPKLVCAFSAVLLTALAPAQQETTFVASATTTHFAALNPNAYTVLMVLGDAAHGARAQMLVSPGASFETDFPSGTLDQIYIEVVFFTAAGRLSSGAVSFDSMIECNSDQMQVTIDGMEAEAWIWSNGTRLSADSGVDLVPESLLGDTPTSSTPMLYDPTHVPVITPTDLTTNNAAPKIQGSNPSV